MSGKMFNVRLEDDLRSEIDRYAEKDSMPTTSAWVREALAAVVELGGLEPLGAVLQRRRRSGGANGALTAEGGRAIQSPHPKRALGVQARSIGEATPSGCSHPKTALKKLPYATICGECGTRIR